MNFFLQWATLKIFFLIQFDLIKFFIMNRIKHIINHSVVDRQMDSVSYKFSRLSFIKIIRCTSKLLLKLYTCNEFNFVTSLVKSSYFKCNIFFLISPPGRFCAFIFKIIFFVLRKYLDFKNVF